jgi:hypothetical protein
VVRGNLAERVLPIQEVGSAILQIVRAGHSARTIPRMEPPS